MRSTFAMIKLTGSMLIFGSIGLLVRFIPLPSSVIAFVRASIGVLFLLLVLITKRTKLSRQAIKSNAIYLLLSGAAIGFNWILLFESYRFTSVAVSTLCYYMAPIIVIILSPWILKERLTAKRFICVMVALGGMIFVSGIFKINTIQKTTLTGVGLGLAAAMLYASAILLNKKMHGIHALDRTVCQLLVAAIVLFPYNLTTVDIDSLTITPLTFGLLAVIGIVHTGLAYYLYFGSMEHLSGQSVAFASYIDPVVAVILSVVILRETFDIYTAMGAVAILAAAWISELPAAGGAKYDN